VDEVFVRINGDIHYLWRAVDHEGEVLVTDRRHSYRAAITAIGSEARQVTSHRLNNRCENSHQPFRRRERAISKFRNAESVQKFASIQSSIQNHFNHERHLYSRDNFKTDRSTALTEWRQLEA
jgi:putative transposase